MNRGQYLSSKISVMGATVVFCPTVCQIGGAWPPVEPELSLCHSASEPVKSHIHWLGPLWLNFIVNHPICCGIVSLDGGGWLKVSHFCKNISDVNSFSGIDE